MSVTVSSPRTQNAAAPAVLRAALRPRRAGRRRSRAVRPAAEVAFVSSSGSLLVLAVAVLKLVAVALWIYTSRHAMAATLFFGGGAVVVYHLLVPSGAGLGRVFTRFVTAHDEVWLTIDDGPDPVDTPRILDLLDRHRARATFFVIGRHAEAHPELVREIVRRGHEVAHHTHTHPSATFWCATRPQVRAQLDRGLAAFRACGVRPRLFRAPVGIKNIFLADELAARRLSCVAWTIRSGDCLAQDAGKIAARVLRRVRPGAIILMHEGPSVSPQVRVEAIAQLLDGLAQRRVRCVIPRTADLR